MWSLYVIKRYHWQWWSSSACFSKWKFDSDDIVLSSTTSNICSNESLSKWKLAKSISWRNPLGICGQRLRYLCYSTGSCSKVLWRPAIQHINSSLCLKHARLWDGPCSFFPDMNLNLISTKSWKSAVETGRCMLHVYLRGVNGCLLCLWVCKHVCKYLCVDIGQICTVLDTQVTLK